MRILYVIPTLRLRDGGPAKALLEMCAYLNRCGHQTCIYTTDFDGDGGRALDSSGQKYNVEVKFFPVRAPRYFKFSPAFAAALRRDIGNFDIVHINSLYMFPSTIAAHYARRSGKPYIVRPHGTLDPYIYARHRKTKYLYELLFERRNLRHAAAVHFTSLEEMQLASSLGLRFRGVVVPLGVKLSHECMPAAREKLGEWYPETRGKKIVLYLGRLNFKKGLDLVAKAMGTICRTRTDIHLLLAGPDDEGYGSKVATWLQTEGAIANTTFAEMLIGERKAAALQGSDVMVLPSYSENFGNAVVEAMASGLPVIISNKVNIWREVAAAGAGVVINCSPQELGDAILAVVDDPLARKRYGERGEQLVAERFTWDIAGAQLILLYYRILAGDRDVPALPKSLNPIRPAQ